MESLITNVHLEGFLQKYSTGPVKSLRKKWFVLRDQALKVYNNPGEAVARTTCQDMIYVHDMQGVRKLASGSSRKCAIEIVSRFKKYTLVAPNPIEQDKWIKGFHNAMHNVRMRSASSPTSFDSSLEEGYNNAPSTPPEVRKSRALSATEGLSKSGSQKKRLLSDSWLGKKLRIKSVSVDEDQLDVNRQRHSSSAVSTYSSEAEDDHSHIYDIVSEFKTIDEVDGAVANTRIADNSEDVFPKTNHDVFPDTWRTEEERPQSGMELYDSVAPDNANVVEIVLRDEHARPSADDQIPEHDLETLMREADEDDEEEEDETYNGTYIGELREDNGVEELRKMIRDSGLEFDHDGEDDDEDAYETLENNDEDASAMSKLRQMLGT